MLYGSWRVLLPRAPKRRNMVPVADSHQGLQTGFSFPRRYLALAAILCLWMAAGATRLVQLQIFDYGDYLTKAQRQQQRTIEVSPKRGIVYDRNFRALAMSVSVDSIFAVPAEIPSPETTASLLARVLEADAADLLARMKGSRSFCWVKRKVSNREVERVRALNLRGIYFQKENKRFYPKRELAAHILGYVGLDDNGLAGIELELDKSIRGRPGKMLIQTDARRRWYSRTERPPDAGQNIILTIDEKIQYIAERELAAAMEATRAQAGSVVVLDPNNGQILAMANRPTFNPNTYAQAPPEAWMNRAVAASYEPGSTFKLVTVAAALEEGLTRPDEIIDCQMGAINIAGHTIHDHKPFGRLAVTQIISNSSDVGAIKLGLRLGDNRMYRHMRDFGFGAPTGVDLPGEARGLLRPAERWSKISIGAISMGQEVGITAMQLIAAVSAIANGGTLHRPMVLKERFRQSPSQRQGLLFAASGSSHPSPERRQVLSPETALELKRMMQQVVVAGTGKKAQLNGWSAAGKTGTAQKADPARGAYSKTDYIASFIGFAPVNSPAISIAVILDSPRGQYHGGTVAAPVFKRIAEQVLSYLDVPRDLPTLPQKEQREVDLAQVTDFAPPIEASEASGAPAATAATTPAFRVPMALPPPDSTVVVDLEGAPLAPGFLGKSVRAVAEQALSLGLEVELLGSGLAHQQVPAPGSRLFPGSKITVRFSH